MRTTGGPLTIPPPVVTPVTRAQTDYYRNAFPNAAHFVGKMIPPEMIRSLDKGNDTYVEARNVKGKLIGYLRDFSGPVTLGVECECDPLTLTLAFDAQYNFKTLIVAAPLTKLDHESFTEQDLARLIQIVKDPPRELQTARRLEDVVDATTSATKAAYKKHVVATAALTTKRVIDIARDTQRILQGAPLAWGRRRLQQLLQQAGEDLELRAKGLAAFIPTAGSSDVAVEAYRIMTNAYIEFLREGGPASRQVEIRLIDPKIDPTLDGNEAVAACYRLVNAGVRLGTADRCATFLRRSGKKIDPAALARLSGSLLFVAGEHKRAVPALEKAAGQFDLIRDPLLHLRLAQALAASGARAAACERGRGIFTEHPLLPGVKKVLETCSSSGGAAAVIDELLMQQKRELLASRLSPGAQAPPVPVEDDNMRGFDLELREAGKITVALFFATWCPHCRVEMPQIVAFVRATKKKKRLRGKVRLVAVRTAVEKETEPWDEFVEAFAPNFPVWTDPVMALAFSKFAKSQGIPPALPTIAVIDDRGYVKYLLRSGDYRDVGRELLWAVDDLLRNPEDPAPAAAESPDGVRRARDQIVIGNGTEAPGDTPAAAASTTTGEGE